MATALATGADFDYAGTVFGNEDLIDLRARTWGAVRLQRCLESLADVRGRVLEVGCGAGRCIRTIRHQRGDLEAHGCDLSSKAIAAARARGDGVVYAEADATDLPYADGSFDAIVVMDLIEHVPDVRQVLGELRRVLRPGGRLHLHVPCEGNLLSVYRPLLALGIDVTGRAVGHVHHFSRIAVLNLLREAGFGVLQQRHSMYFFGQLHDLIGWWSRLRRDGAGIASITGSGGEVSPAAPRPSDRRPRLKRMLTRPVWWLIHHVLPWLQYAEVRALSWQPVGAVGLCLRAERRR